MIWNNRILRFDSSLDDDDVVSKGYSLIDRINNLNKGGIS